MSPGGGAAMSGEHVVLLHGLARSGRSMRSLERRFFREGFQVSPIDYPSREKTIGELAGFLKREIDSRSMASAGKVHFITHSMGGIVLRYYLSRYPIGNLGRVVMISPPNRGSEIVDRLRNNYLFKRIYGPACQQLGTDPASFVNTLGPVNFDLGVITGDRSCNPVFSSWIQGDDDGKVSTLSAQIEGMNDFLVVHYGHTFIMNKDMVADQALSFISNGRFADMKLPVKEK